MNTMDFHSIVPPLRRNFRTFSHKMKTRVFPAAKYALLDGLMIAGSVTVFLFIWRFCFIRSR